MFPWLQHAPVIPRQHLPGLSRPLSRLVLGSALSSRLDNWEEIADAFVERGGNLIDTAWVYGQGKDEAVVGRWLRNRKWRGEISCIVKGAHTPHCHPERIPRQLSESLERLGIETAPIYLMHRDNPDVPVEEFVDVLDELSVRGLIGVYGGSNWTLERVDAANAYAQRKGRRGFRVLSNQFSLAEMVKPMWEGCISASDAASRTWLADKQIPNFAWSSQARGFFTGRAHPEKTEEKELVECWYSKDNFERKRRARELAELHGVEEINVSLAYVLAQPFPSYCLIGPQTVEELTSTLGALRLQLSQPECRWLNLETKSL